MESNPDLGVQPGLPLKKHQLLKNIPWLSLFILTMMNIFIGNFYYAFSFFYVEFVEAFSVSRSEAGWVGSIQIFVSMVTGIFFSAPIHRFGNRIILCSGTLIVCTSLVAASFATNIYVLCVTFGLSAGVGLSAIYMVTVIVSQHEFKKYRTFLTGIIYAGYGLGQLFSSPLTVHLVNRYGWRGALILHAGILTQLLICATLLPNRSHTQTSVIQNENNPTNTRKSRLKTILQESFDCSLMKGSAFCLYNIGTLLIRMSSIAFIVHMPSKLIHQGISKQQAALLIMIQSAINLICKPFVGIIADLKSVDTFLVHIAGGIMVVLATFMAVTWKSYTGTCLALFLNALHMAAWNTIVPVILVDLMGLSNIGRSYAINNLFFGVATLVSPPLTGWLFDVTQDYDVPYYVNGVMGCVASVFIMGTYIIQKKKHLSKTAQGKQSQMTDHLKDIDTIQREPLTTRH